MDEKYTLGFLLANEYSSYNCAIGLASILANRGHEVIFFVRGNTVFPQYLHKHGFASTVVQVEPKHSPRPKKFQWWRRLQTHRKRVQFAQTELKKTITHYSPDLIFLSALIPYPYSLVLAELRIPTLLLFGNFASRWSTRYPPVFSSKTATGKANNIYNRFINCCLWRWAVTTRGRAISYDRSQFMAMVISRICARIYQRGYEKKLRKAGWQSTWSEWWRRPIIPEIVFGYRQLDWPAVAHSQRYYLASVDLCRNSSAFDWSKIRSQYPIVYCCISTAHGFAQTVLKAKQLEDSHQNMCMAKRFVEVVLQAFSQRQQWQLIISCGLLASSFQDRPWPPNIHIFSKVPQLDVLTRANLAICWAGSGTIRECISFGVPMLLFPAWTDQFGSTARVVSKNLGLQGNILKVSSQQIIKMTESILGNDTIHAATQKMKNQSKLKLEIRGLLKFVEQHTGLEGI